jgi:hypothetical protein
MWQCGGGFRQGQSKQREGKRQCHRCLDSQQYYSQQVCQRAPLPLHHRAQVSQHPLRRPADIDRQPVDNNNAERALPCMFSSCMTGMSRVFALRKGIAGDIETMLFVVSVKVKEYKHCCVQTGYCDEGLSMSTRVQNGGACFMDNVHSVTWIDHVSEGPMLRWSKECSHTQPSRLLFFAAQSQLGVGIGGLLNTYNTYVKYQCQCNEVLDVARKNMEFAVACHCHWT